MQTRISDFTTLFNLLWYRDFPVALGSIEWAKRADWTTHIASTVRQVASITGMFSCFESGGRTDAELQFADRKVWAKLEWEWSEPRNDDVGELAKLAGAASTCEVCVFIGYSQLQFHDANLAKIKAEWAGVQKPLLAILVTFEQEGGALLRPPPDVSHRCGCNVDDPGSACVALVCDQQPLAVAWQP